jgi:hypothetical protein
MTYNLRPTPILKRDFQEKNFCKEIQFTVRKDVLLFWRSHLLREENIFENFEEWKIIEFKAHTNFQSGKM